MDTGKAPSPSFHHISKTTIRQSSSASDSGELRRIIHLTPWDLRLLFLHYIQKGLLFPKPPDFPLPSMAARLESSLPLALRHFFPLSGRLATNRHHSATSSPSLSISIDCNDQGAELIVAKAETFTAADVLACQPGLLRSLFPLDGATSHDGHGLPLLSIQLTELSRLRLPRFLHEPCRRRRHLFLALHQLIVSDIPFRRHLPPSITRPLVPGASLPSPPPSSPTMRPAAAAAAAAAEAYFFFSAKTIAELKARANAEAINAGVQISSLQALLAHLWRSVSRARKLLPEQETSYFLAAGSRERLRPPLPAAYFGNALLSVAAKVFAGELAEQGLGWAARRLNEAVAGQGDKEIRERLLAFAEKPTSFIQLNEFAGNCLLTGSSPKFEVFGNDFGWGRPMAVRGGAANKVDGTATVFPGGERGGVGIQLRLMEEAMASLLDDFEFMDTTSSEFDEG